MASSNGRKRRIAAWSLGIVGLAGFNGWWAWTHRPTEEPRSVERLLATKRYDQAEAELRRAIRLSPWDGESRIRLARALAGQNKLVECARTLETVPRWWPKRYESLYRAGQAYLQSDRAADAERAWLACLDDDPLHPTPFEYVNDAALGLVKLYITQDRVRDAIDILFRTHDRAEPIDRTVLLSMRMRLEIERLAPEASAKDLRRYIAADPNDWQSLRALARAELGRNQGQESDRLIRDAIERFPEHPEVWIDAFRIAFERGDLEALRRCLDTAPRTVDRFGETWKYRGILHERAGNWQLALDSFQKAREFLPDDIEVNHRAALMLGRLGRKDEAREIQTTAQKRRDALGKMEEYFLAYNDEIRKPDARNSEIASHLRRLAEACRELDWTREARAWTLAAEDYERLDR